MKPAPAMQFRSDLHLLLWKPRGLLNEMKVNEVLAFIAEVEAVSEANELRFIDATALTKVKLSFRYVFHVALYRRFTRKGRPTLKSAVWVTDKALAHYFKLHALLTDQSSLRVRIFDTREAAAKWLKVPVEMLETN